MNHFPYTADLRPADGAETRPASQLEPMHVASALKAQQNHAPPQLLVSSMNETSPHEVSRTTTTNELFLKRPDTSGKPLDAGFVFPKCVSKELDFTGTRRGPAAAQTPKAKPGSEPGHKEACEHPQASRVSD